MDNIDIDGTMKAIQEYVRDLHRNGTVAIKLFDRPMSLVRISEVHCDREIECCDKYLLALEALKEGKYLAPDPLFNQLLEWANPRGLMRYQEHKRCTKYVTSARFEGNGIKAEFRHEFETMSAAKWRFHDICVMFLGWLDLPSPKQSSDFVGDVSFLNYLQRAAGGFARLNIWIQPQTDFKAVPGFPDLQSVAGKGADQHADSVQAAPERASYRSVDMAGGAGFARPAKNSIDPETKRSALADRIAMILHEYPEQIITVGDPIDYTPYETMISLYRALAAGLGDIINRGVLSDDVLPDDFQWLTETLALIPVHDGLFVTDFRKVTSDEKVELVEILLKDLTLDQAHAALGKVMSRA